jgi:hypothetical protein
MSIAVHVVLTGFIVWMVILWGPFPRVRAWFAYLNSGQRTIDRAVARVHKRRALVQSK